MFSSTFVNIASHLPEMARKQPETLAVVQPCRRDRADSVKYNHYTYRQLDEESDCFASGLDSIGIRRGVRTVLMVKPSLEFFALTFALLRVGAIPVLVDPGMGIKNLGQCLEEAEPEAFIGISKAHTARVLFRWARRTIRIRVTVGRRWFWGGYTLDQVRQAGKSGSFAMAHTSADETAAILFTSGSTGVPKGAVYTHGIFSSQVELLRQTYGIEPGEIDLTTFPLFALFAPALGMTAIIPDMDFTRPGHVDPCKIIGPVQELGVTSMFGSPALLDRVGRHGEKHDVRMPSLRRVISAGAPVSSEIVERFAKMLAQGVQVHTPYGATEALPVCSIGSDEILKQTRFETAKGAGICVGRPIGPVRVNIIRISDEPIPEWSEELLLPRGEIGEIVVEGPIVTRSYFNRPQSTALAKIADPGRGVIRHRMGDLGYFDEQGRLWFCGRKSHRVVTTAGTLFTIPCEAVFNAHPRVRRTALVGVGAIGAALPVLCVELKKPSGDTGVIRNELLSLGSAYPLTKEIKTILFHPEFPVDVRHNSKIFREKLAEWAVGRT